MNKHIKKVLSIVGKEIGSDWGAQAELARRLNIAPSYMNKIVKTGHVPSEQCKKIEAVVGGQVTAEELRPDIFCPVKAA